MSFDLLNAGAQEMLQFDKSHKLIKYCSFKSVRVRIFVLFIHINYIIWSIDTVPFLFIRLKIQTTFKIMSDSVMTINIPV